MNRKKRIAGLMLALTLVLLAGLVFFARRISFGLSGNQSTSKFPVQIQEYMSSNTLYPNENGVCTDWVELYNAASAPIDIGGFKLTDENRKFRFTIPSGTIIPADGYYLIYCLRSGGSEYADFGISRSGGEDLMLLNRKNVLIDSVTTMALPENASAERDEDGVFRISTQPSPGGAAALAAPVPAEESAETVLQAAPGAISISEVIPGNTLFADERGLFADMVELVNTSDGPMDIGGYMLQDGLDGRQLEIPQGTVLEGGGYYLIHCARTQTEGLYADFALSRNGGEMLLLYSDTGALTDYLTTEPCLRNESTVRDQGITRTSSFITPGFPNTAEGYEACLAAYTANSPVRFSEIMIANDSFSFPDGSTPDWVELYNSSAASVDLSGCGLSDSAASVRYVFPAGTTIEPNGYLLIPCDGNGGRTEGSAHLGLSARGGETVYLTTAEGALCGAAFTVATGRDVSLVYADGVRPTLCTEPTPGFANDAAGAAAYRATRPAYVTGLIISEFMPSNDCALASGSGHFADWVELYNEGSADIDLGGFYLSDREKDLQRFPLPRRVLSPGEYVLIWCSKEITGASGEIWAPFGLSSKGGDLFLTAATGDIVDRATYAAAEGDRSFIREEGAFVMTDCPSPGFPNTAAGYKACLADRVPQGLYISEVMPSNRSVARIGGNYYDWVELCNGTDSSLVLSDYCLTDDANAPDKYTLPQVTLKSGEYFILYCSGDVSLTDKEGYHCPFKLNGGEDRVYLYGADGRLVDYLHVYKVPPQGSIGRTGREGRITLYEAPTPKRENKNGTELGQFSVMPTANIGSGVFDDSQGFTVTLSAPGEIYYTTDGSKPTAMSSRYTQPIEISKTSVLRAAALEEDKCFSDVLTLAYTLNEGHTLPVMNLILAPDDLEGNKGIYSHPNETWQKNACIVYTDENGTVTHDCGVRMAGQHARTRLQKSFKLVFSDQYGGRLRYDIFGDSCEQKTFPQLLLRSGLDYKYGIYREPLAQQMAIPYRSTTFVQDSVPCVVYINGEYYGIYQFMESLCEETLADRLGVHTESITLFKGYLYPGHKNLEIYQLMEYVEKHDMQVSEYYEYAKAHLALEDLIDWAIFEGYCHNADLSGNIRYFKSSETDDRWHFVFYDVECGFKVDASFDVVVSTGQTAIFIKALLKNSEFRDMFLKRLQFHCENTFRQDQVLPLLYWYDNAVREESKRHFTRWNLQPVTYIYNYNLFERLLKADRATQLKLSAKKILDLSDEEYDSYFRS